MEYLQNFTIKPKHLYNFNFFAFLFAQYINSEFRPFLEILVYILFSMYIIFSRKKMTKYFFWSLVFLSMCIISLNWSYDLTQATLLLRINLQSLLIGNLIIGYVDSEDKLYDFMDMFIVAGFFLIVYLLINLPLSTLITTRLGGQRLIGINSNTLGLNIAISSLFLFFKILRLKKMSHFLLYLLLIIFVFLSGSRQALLLAILGAILILLFSSKDAVKKLKNIYVIFFLIVIVYNLLVNVPLLYEIVGYRLETLILTLFGAESATESDQIRNLMVSSGINLIKDRPFLGYGLGGFAKVSGLGVYSHNNYIELLVGIGIVGTVIYYYIYIYIIKQLYSIRNISVAIPFLSVMIVLLIIELALVSHADIFWPIIVALAYSAVNILSRKTNGSHYL